jgi:hypothetical protein
MLSELTPEEKAKPSLIGSAVKERVAAKTGLPASEVTLMLCRFDHLLASSEWFRWRRANGKPLPTNYMQVSRTHRARDGANDMRRRGNEQQGRRGKKEEGMACDYVDNSRDHQSPLLHSGTHCLLLWLLLRICAAHSLRVARCRQMYDMMKGPLPIRLCIFASPAALCPAVVPSLALSRGHDADASCIVVRYVVGCFVSAEDRRSGTGMPRVDKNEMRMKPKKHGRR